MSQTNYLIHLLDWQKHSNRTESEIMTLCDFPKLIINIMYHDVNIKPSEKRVTFICIIFLVLMLCQTLQNIFFGLNR